MARILLISLGNDTNLGEKSCLIKEFLDACIGV